MKSGWIPFLTGSVLCGVLLIGCKPAEKASPPKTDGPPRSVRVAKAEMHPLEHALTVVGSLAAREEALVAAQVAGQIERCLVDLGDTVSAGQDLAMIDTAAFEARRRQSAANLDRAKAAAANANQTLRRVRELQAGKIASASDLDQAVAAAEQSEAEVKAAEAELAVAQLNLDRSHVKAPFAGAVAARPAGVGDYVAIGAPIVRLVQTNPLRLRLDVPERDSSSVRTGQAVRLTLTGDTNVYGGQLVRIAPAIRAADRMLVVEADVPNPGALRAGLFARAQIVINPQDAALCVPARALITFAGLDKVVILKEGRAVEKTITLGRRAEGWIEVLTGLNAGETVVLEPAGIRTGQPLTVNAN